MPDRIETEKKLMGRPAGANLANTAHFSYQLPATSYPLANTASAVS